MTSRRLLHAIFLILSMGTPPILADTHGWTGSDPRGNWWDYANNWSPAAQPGDGDAVNILRSGSTAYNIDYWNTLYPTAQLGTLTLNQTGGGTVSLNMNMSQTLTAGVEYIGTTGRAAIIQNAGTHTVSQDLNLGCGSLSNASYYLGSGGWMDAYQLNLGVDGGIATFTQDGGTVHHSWGNSVHVNSGTYLFNSGQIYTTFFSVGLTGNGTFVMNGGSASVVSWAYIGNRNDPANNGYLSLVGGTISFGRGLYLDSGTIVQYGGAITGNEFGVQYQWGIRGVYQLKGGLMDIPGIDLEVYGAFDQTAGHVGAYGYRVFGTYTLSGAGECSARGYYGVAIGNGSGSPACFSMSGGALTTPMIALGSNSMATGDGRFDQSGGTVIAGSIALGGAPYDTRLIKSAGTLSVGSISNAGSFSHTGGTLSVSSSLDNTGSCLIGGVQRWTSGSVFTNTAGVATFTSDAGSDGKNLVVDANGGTVVFDSTQHLQMFRIHAGSAASVTPGSRKIINTNNIPVDGGSAPVARLDLASSALVIDYSGASPVSTVFDQIRTAWSGGFWNANGIASSTADRNVHTLGYGEAASVFSSFPASFCGESIDSTTVLAKYTYFGDANLDGQVDITDLGRLATAWQTAGLWVNGDFNYDGFIDISDLGKLATNWQAGVGNPLGPSFDQALTALGLPGTTVPEPMAASVAGLIGVLLARPPRRRVWE